MEKTRLNISLDHDLAKYVKIYAQENRTTTSEIFTQFILGLKRKSQRDSMDIIYSDPDFHEAVLDVQKRLKNGSSEWHSYEEVFGN